MASLFTPWLAALLSDPAISAMYMESENGLHGL